MTGYCNVKKIAFAGTHGVGKTTIIKSLAEKMELQPINVIHEVASKVYEMGKTDPALAINQGATLEAQLRIIGMQIEQENQQIEEIHNSDNSVPKILLCDRTALDAVAYTYARTFRGDKYVWARALPKYLFDWAVSALSCRYDVVFYIPISFPLVGDGVRPADPEFQEEIDVLMQDLFIRNKLAGTDLPEMKKLIRHTEILSGAEDRRTQVVESVLARIEAQDKCTATTLHARMSMPPQNMR